MNPNSGRGAECVEARVIEIRAHDVEVRHSRAGV